MARRVIVKGSCSATAMQEIEASRSSKKARKTLLQRQINHLPGEAANIEFLHEGVGIVLLHVPDAGCFPEVFQDHLGTDHGGHAGGVADGLAGDGLKSFDEID